MKKYTTLLFDLDDTLLDFKATEKASLPKVFGKFGYDFTEVTKATYERENRALWDAYEKGIIPLEEVLDNRFSNTMKNYGIDIDGHEWDVYYRFLLSEGLEVVDGAIELCEELFGKYRLFVITNGIEKTQISRLTRTGMLKYFEGIFISQTIGLRKPERGFFEYVEAHIPDFDKEHTLVIGDSLTTDIRGGREYGLDTCLFDRFLKHGDKNGADFIIHTLGELPGRLE